MNAPRTTPRVTIVVTPRERFGVAARALQSIYDSTQAPFDLIYVSSAAPRGLRALIDAEAARRGFRHIAKPHAITPNDARNLGAAAARTDYIVFIDNDVICAEGWLEALIACADETHADIVTPLTCQGEPVHQIVHQAGGRFTEDLASFFATPRGERRMIDEMPLQGTRVSDHVFVRGETQCCEFHCVLVRRSTLEAIGGLDPHMLATKEHIDLCISVLERGGKVMFEPASVVTYLFPNRNQPLTLADWPYFLVRWSPQWQRRSIKRLQRKWGLAQEGYVAERSGRLSWRHYEGVVRPSLRRVPFLKEKSFAHRAAGRAAREAVAAVTGVMTAHADFRRRLDQPRTRRA